jgi:hypothetical protein
MTENVPRPYRAGRSAPQEAGSEKTTVRSVAKLEGKLVDGGGKVRKTSTGSNNDQSNASKTLDALMTA